VIQHEIAEFDDGSDSLPAKGGGDQLCRVHGDRAGRSRPAARAAPSGEGLPPEAMAVKVTVDGRSYDSAQSVPQTMPPSYEVTMPFPILDTTSG
jgi:hypothetical protein